MSDNPFYAWDEEHDELAERYDECKELPQPGENPAFDAFLVSKNLSLASMYRLGVKLSSDVDICIPFKEGLKFRNIVTGAKSSWSGSSFRTLRILKASAPCVGVLIVEGETDGARCTDLYPELDIAILPAGVLNFNLAMATQLQPYARILVGTDNDEPGHKGAAKIIAMVPIARRFIPPVSDWCDVKEGDSIPDPLDGAYGGFTGLQIGRLSFPDLREVDLTPQPLLLEGLLYPQGIHWLDGVPGGGKTSFCMYMAVQLMLEENRDIVWFDYETSVKPALRRLYATGISKDLVVDKFHYINVFPKAEETMIDAIQEWPNCVVVLDSASKALAVSGLDENSNSEVTSWTVQLIQHAATTPIIVIDHISKTAKGSLYSRGAGAKLADADVHWRVDKLERFNKTTEGLVQLDLHKDRPGDINPFKRWYRVGGDLGLLFEETDDPKGRDEAPEGTTIVQI